MNKKKINDRSPNGLEEVPVEKIRECLKCPLTGLNAGQGPGKPLSKQPEYQAK